MKPTRSTQPYRSGKGPLGSARAAMTRGRTAYGQNPQDLKRAVQRKRKRRRKPDLLRRAFFRPLSD